MTHPTVDTKERIKTRPFDAAKFLDTLESQAELLNDALETGDRAYILDALGIIARARGMTSLQKDTGLNRATLYAALDKDGNPTLQTILAVFDALGLKLAVVTAMARIDSAERGVSRSRKKSAMPA